MMQLIDMNNMSVGAMQQGRPKRALFLLATALACIKDHFARRQQEESNTNETGETSAASLRRQLPRFVSDSSVGAKSEWPGGDVQQDKERAESSVFSAPSGVISSYNYGLVLNYNKALMVLHSLDDLEVLTGVVLYNMAIVKHGQAMEKGSSTILTAALMLYKTATHVIKRKQDIDIVSDFVLLVAYHNMAHIYVSHFCPEELRGCFDATRFLLAQVSTRRFLDRDDMQFFSNSAFLAVKDIRFAPAA
jgi:hypothetical protein